MKYKRNECLTVECVCACVWSGTRGRKTTWTLWTRWTTGQIDCTRKILMNTFGRNKCVCVCVCVLSRHVRCCQTPHRQIMKEYICFVQFSTLPRQSVWTPRYNLTINPCNTSELCCYLKGKNWRKRGGEREYAFLSPMCILHVQSSHWSVCALLRFRIAVEWFWTTWACPARLMCNLSYDFFWST